VAEELQCQIKGDGGNNVNGVSKRQRVKGKGNLQSGSDVDIILWKGADVPRPFIMINDLFVVESSQRWSLSNRS